MHFKKLILSITFLLSLSSTQATWSSKLGKVMHIAAITNFLGTPLYSIYTDKVTIDEAKKNLQKAALNPDDHILAEPAVYDYIIKRAQNLNINTQNFVVTMDVSNQLNAQVKSFEIDGQRHIQIDLGSIIHNQLHDNIANQAVNESSIIVEHELIHAKEDHVNKGNNLEFARAIGAPLFFYALGYKNFKIAATDAFFKSFKKGVKINVLGTLSNASMLLINAYRRNYETEADLQAIKNINHLESTKEFKKALIKMHNYEAMDLTYKLGKSPDDEKALEEAYKILEYTKLFRVHPSPKDREAYIDKAIQELEAPKSK